MPLTQILTRSVLIVATLFAFSTAHADNLKDIAALANKQGQQAAALDRINAYITANPKDVQALFIKGVILAEQNRSDEAIKVFTTITEKSPNLPEPYNNLAVLYADKGQYDKARKALENAIKTHPSYATAHENLGDIYARMASESYDKALQLDSGNSRAQNKLGLIKDLFSGTKRPVVAAAPSVAAPAAVVAAPTKPEPVATPVKTTSIDPEDPANSAAMGNDDDITSAVQKWAKAWSAKDINQYLASYSPTFKPNNGKSRKSWEKVRKVRVTKPGPISVKLSSIKIDMQDADNAKVTFQQKYKSRNLSQRTRKVLTMRNVDGKWLIEREKANN